MKRAIPVVAVLVVALLGGGLALSHYLKGQAISPTELPTLAVIPTSTETDTPTDTVTPSPTLTFTPSPTLTLTPSETPTATMTLATRVLVVTAVAPGIHGATPVALSDTATPIPLPTLEVPMPPPR